MQRMLLKVDDLTWIPEYNDAGEKQFEEVEVE